MYVGVDSFGRPGCGSASGLPAHQRRPDDFRDLENCVFYKGMVTKIGGTTLQGSAIASVSVPWLFHAYSDTSGLRVTMCQAGAALYQKITTGGWTAISGGGSLSTTAYPVAVQYKNKVYWVNGASALVITIANPPVASSWTTLASGAAPTCVCLHLNRLYYDHGSSRRSQIHYTNFGDPTVTDSGSAFNVPDDQAGFYPTIFLGLGDRIIFFCQDYIVMLTGAGPFTFNKEQAPRGAALFAWRTAVNMGEYVMFLGTDGIYVTDGTRAPQIIDLSGRINFDDWDMRTVEHTHAVRVDDEYCIFFRSKGDQVPALSRPAKSMSLYYYMVASRLTRTLAASAPTTTSHYYRISRRTGQYSGPHTGPWLSAAWQQFSTTHSDNQELWFGSAFAGGKVAAADQTTFTHVTSTGNTDILPMRWRSGSLAPRDEPGAQFKLWKVEEVVLAFGTQKRTAGGGSLRVYFDGKLTEWSMERTIPLSKKQPGIRGEACEPGELEMPEGAVYAFRPNGEEQNIGYWPEMEFEELSDQPVQIWGFGAEVGEERA